MDRHFEINLNLNAWISIRFFPHFLTPNMFTDSDCTLIVPYSASTTFCRFVSGRNGSAWFIVTANR